jgi:3-hydroxyisobutyrate dehydrogenase-like beta-hydroxyacid dehydrogenase
MTAVAFLGLGRMGTPMAHRLLDAGHELVVWNRNIDRTDPLVAAGASRAATPAEAADQADVVITMLTDAVALRAVVLGPDGVAKGIRPDTVLVDMSTVGPNAVRSLAAELPTSVRCVDAPVSGSVDQATAGTLVILAGGESTDVDAVEPVLATLGTLRRCGGPGMGAAAKLVAIATRIAAMALVGGARAVAAGLGVPDDLTAELLQEGPLADTLRRAEQPAAHYTLALAEKDLRLALAGVDPAAAPVTAAVLDRAASAADADRERDVRALAAAPSSTGRRPFVRIDNPDGVAPPVGPYSHVARLDLGTGTLLTLSGQIAVDDAGDLVGEGDIRAQTRRIFEIIGGILGSHGATLADVVNIRTFMTDLGMLPAYGEVRRQYLASTPPTSTTVEVPRLFRPGALLEIEVTAAVA